MYKKFRIISVIPARGGSKRIPLKNIKPLLGKPLIEYTIKQAKDSKYIDEIYVSSDNESILEISRKLKVSALKRPDSLSTDFATMTDVLKHLNKTLKFKSRDIIVLLQPSSPLRKTKTIDAAIKEFVENYSKFDSLIPLVPIKEKMGTLKGHRYVPLRKDIDTRSQDIKNLFAECGTVFIYKPQNLAKDNIYGKRIYPFIIHDSDDATDIDTIEQFNAAEQILQGGKK
jgi:CMP-N,N'-diacetyllegionaminic acid synthase